jgi:membrane associated rhomboid family serine protease
VLPLKDNIPTSRFALVTVLLIVINVGVFLWQQSYPPNSPSGQAPQANFTADDVLSERDQIDIEYGAIPYRLTHPGKDCAVTLSAAGSQTVEPDVVCEGTSDYSQAEADNRLAQLDEPPWLLTVFTSMFMHGGLLHILFNMLFLWIFGNNVEDAMGRLKYLLFYLAAGVAALYSQAAIDPGSTLPTIGASGAVAGVLGAYALLHPRARVLTVIFIVFFVTVVEIPAMVMLGIWFVLQFIPAIGQVATPDVTGGGGVAYFAHVGGFIFGLATVKLLARRRDGPGEAPPALRAA